MTKLLVVDDNEQNRYLLQALLSGNGYEVMVAADGIEALEKARANPPDLIITDILMPGMDGYQLCRAWKRDEMLKDIPYVVYTATYTDPRDEELALNMGVQRFILKPQEPEALLEIIEEVIAEHKAGRLLPEHNEVIEDTVYFREYNQALIRKLEDKLVELGAAKASLEAEVAERMRTEEALKRSEKELNVRSRIAGKFLTVSDEEVFADVLPIVLEVLDSEIGVFGYLDENGALVVPSMTRHVWDTCNVPDKRIVFPCDSWGDTIWAQAIQERRTLCSNEPCFRVPEGHVPIDRVITVPIINQGQVVGLFQAANKKSDYDEQDVRLLESIANAVAPILNARLQRDQQEKRRVFAEGQLRQAQKMEAIGQLAGGVAHDFNNVLQAIMGYTTFAIDAAEPESEQYDNLVQVMKGAEHAANLTRQLLAFSRQQVLRRSDVDLGELVNGLLKMIRRVIGENIQLDFSYVQGLSAVHGDAGQLEQVVLNLCINARDAMPDGGGLTIRVENAVIDEVYRQANPWAQLGSYVVLKIMDTGIGMDSETQKRIFDPFFTTKEVGQGTGLGLATVYGIVKQHDGMVNVYSEPGRGTVFKVYLPAVEPVDTEVGQASPAAVAGGTETILFAEDDRAIRALGIRILERAGYTVLSAVDGEEAVEAFAAHANEIDLVVLDVVMPKLGAPAAAEKIKALRSDVRLLFSSGYGASMAGMRSILSAGGQLIEKPYEPRALLQKVREMLDSPVSD
ncbi:MAG TPA: response regulator [Candidatus Hydrogenedentes bacterium]|nr:response regulator [Candidatus Hydrogenedentota bacterium]